MLDGSFILATSAIRLITVVPASLLGLTKAKMTLNSLIHPLNIVLYLKLRKLLIFFLGMLTPEPNPPPLKPE